jgi:hypothetical protein
LARFRFFGGVFLVTGATLMLEIIQTRILSVVAWYHLAFFVISIAMFGLTAGAIWVYLRRERFSEATLSFDLGWFSLAFALTTVASLAIQMTLPLTTGVTATSIVVWTELAVCMAAPFFFSGVVVSLALTRSPFPIGLVYGVDLLGAAAGCVGVFVALNATDGPSAVLWVAVIAAAAAVLFAGSRVGTFPAAAASPQAAIVRRMGWILSGLVLVALLNGLSKSGLQPVSIKGTIESDRNLMFEEWNSFSRVAVFDRTLATRKRKREGPHMWGASPRFQPKSWPTVQRVMNIDGDAATAVYRFDGVIKRAGFLRWDVTSFAYYLPGRERAAVIGVGGGRDVLTAKVFGVTEVTGVEINPIFIRLLTRDPEFVKYAGLRDLPGVRLVVDEARSWFARTDQTFDIIQMSLVDTWAATGAGAYTLSENGLYTVQAWQVFLERLDPDGVFTVSRWYAPGEVNELGRLVSLAVATLLDAGVTEPWRHLFVVSSGKVATLVLSKSPLAGGDLGALERAADELAYKVLVSPNAVPASTVLEAITRSTDRTELAASTSEYLLDLMPPTDERPFFFNQLPMFNPQKLIELARGSPPEGLARGNLYASATLLVLLLISLALVLAAIVIPARSAVRDVGRKLVVSGTAYFVLIGVGFMSVEIGLLQRMTVFLGHPIYSLVIVLFAMILATGLGSMIADRVRLDSRPKVAVWAALTAGYVASLPAWLPGVLLSLDAAELATRAALCVLVIAPAGLLMGFGFPTGMTLVSAIDRRPTPWFWGVNGAAGVLAAILAVACSIGFGISTTLILGSLCYVLVIPAAWSIGFAPREPAR